MHPVWLTFSNVCLEQSYQLHQARRPESYKSLFACLLLGLLASSWCREEEWIVGFKAVGHAAAAMAGSLLCAIWMQMLCSVTKVGSTSMKLRAAVTLRLLYFLLCNMYHYLLSARGNTSAEQLGVTLALHFENVGAVVLNMMIFFVGLRVHLKMQLLITVVGILWSGCNYRAPTAGLGIIDQDSKDELRNIIEAYFQISNALTNMHHPSCLQSPHPSNHCRFRILIGFILLSSFLSLSPVWLLELIERERYLKEKTAKGTAAEVAELEEESFLLQSGYDIDSLMEGPWIPTMVSFAVVYSVLISGVAAGLLA